MGKHFTTVPTTIDGYKVFRLIDDEGDTVRAFDAFLHYCIHVKCYPASTVFRYTRAVATFLDYLTEVGVFGRAATRQEINQAIDRYPTVRMNADHYRCLDPTISKDEFAVWAHHIVTALSLRQLNAPGNTVAAINHFLRRANAVALEEWEEASRLGLEKPSGSYRALIEAVDGYEPLRPSQRKALRQNSFLAAVAGFNPNGIAFSKRLQDPRVRGAKPNDLMHLDFPLKFLPDLFKAAKTKRDLALWTLLAGIGIRMSEAMNLQWEHIDIPNLQVYVEDPKGLRFSRDLPKAISQRFKGRAISETIWIPQLRAPFFRALQEYLEREYVIRNDHDFVFVRLHPHYDKHGNDILGELVRRALENAGIGFFFDDANGAEGVRLRKKARKATRG